MFPKHQVLFQNAPAYRTTEKCLHVQTNFDKYPNENTCQTSNTTGQTRTFIARYNNQNHDFENFKWHQDFVKLPPIPLH